MALLTSEVIRVRAELGYNVMGLQAIPYIGISAIFDEVIQQYITAGASTTSSTPVTAADEPTPQTLALGSGAGFSAGCRVVVDVDDRQEVVTVQNMPGANSLTALMQKAHTGTYPVTVEGGESIVREHLQHLRLLNGPGSVLTRLADYMGIKKVDEIEFFGGGSGGLVDGKDPLTQVRSLIEYHRDELASALGVERLNRRGGGGGVEIY